MRKPNLRIMLAFLLFFGAFIISPTAKAQENVYLQVTHATITNPVVRTSTSPSTVEFAVYFKASESISNSSDLTCGDNSQTVYAVISSASNSELKATCTFSYTSSIPAGLRTINMSSSPKFSLVPANALNSVLNKERDSFGQMAEVQYKAYEIFARKAIFLSAPIAIDPPTSYVYPTFPMESGSYIVFDVRNNQPIDLKIAINTKTKNFSVQCPDSVINSGISSQAKIFGKTLSFGGWGTLGISPKDPKKTFSYLSGFFKGKTLNLVCMYFIGMKDPYGGVQLSYFESKSKTVSFPKK